MTITMKHGLIALLGTTSLTAVAAPVLAAAPAATAGNGVEEVVVNARRRTETLQTTPLAVTAMSTAQLEAKGSVNISDLSGAAPNLLITQQNSGPAATNAAIRGLAFADIEKSFEPTVGVVVDGVFLGTSTGQLLDSFDLKSIEILRGPQGTLFGRNTIGGVINANRTEPTGHFGGKAEFSYASYNTKSIRAVLNLPSLGDVLATKLFIYNGRSDGFYNQAGTGRHTGGYNNTSYGAAFKFTPGHDFTALLTLEDMHQRFTPVNSNICETNQAVPELFCTFEPTVEQNRNTTTDLYTYFGSPATSTYDAPAATLQLNQKIGSTTITAITGVRSSHEAQTQDFDASSANFYYTNRIQRFHQFSQELRVAGKLTDSFDYVVGGYYFNSAYFLNQSTNVFGNPVPGQLATGTNRSYAAFADFDYKVFDRVRLNFGGRYTHDEKGFYDALLTPVSAGGGVPATPGAAQILQVLTTSDGTATGTPATKHVSFNKFTPKVSLDWRPTDDVMLYASWSRGYRSGGFSNRAQTVFSANRPFGPETVDSYEIGEKGAFLDHRLVVNLSAFIAKYNNMQQNTTVPGGPTGNETVVANVGSSTIKGIEADVTVRPAPPLTLSATLGILDSHFHGFITGVGTAAITDYSAVNLIYSPKANASFHAAYKSEISENLLWRVNADFKVIAPYDQQISIGDHTDTTVGGVTTRIVHSNDPRVRTKTQGILDASTSFTLNPHGNFRTTLTLFGRNLTNDRGTSAAFTVAGLWSFASAREPRTFGVKIGAEF